MDTDLLTPPPNPDAPADDAPKRRTRRPRTVQSLDSQAPPDPSKAPVVDTAPKRTRSTGARVKVTAAQAAKIKTGTAVAIKLLDGGAHKLAPDLWTAQDAFTSRETAALVDAVWLELETFPKALAWLVKVADRGVHAQVAAICIAVALPRLVSRGIVPPVMGLFSEAILSGDVDVATIMGAVGAANGASGAAGSAGEAASFMGAGAAHFGGGSNGAGQNDPDSGAAAGAFVHGGAPQQTR